MSVISQSARTARAEIWLRAFPSLAIDGAESDTELHGFLCNGAG